MGNAINPIKEIADYVTDTNDNNGVAKAIEKICIINFYEYRFLKPIFLIKYIEI